MFYKICRCHKGQVSAKGTAAETQSGNEATAMYHRGAEKAATPAYVPATLPTALAKSVGAQIATDPKLPLLTCTTVLCTSFSPVIQVSSAWRKLRELSHRHH